MYRLPKGATDDKEPGEHIGCAQNVCLVPTSANGPLACLSFTQGPAIRCRRVSASVRSDSRRNGKPVPSHMAVGTGGRGPPLYLANQKNFKS